MIAYQFHGKIFYRVYKDVEAGTEFLVWYGEEYAGELGIALEGKPQTVNMEPGKCKGLFSILFPEVHEMVPISKPSKYY